MNQALYTSLNSTIFQIKGVDILINDSSEEEHRKEPLPNSNFINRIWQFHRGKRMKVIFKTKNSEMFSIPD